MLNFEQTLNQSKSTRAKKLTLSSSPKKSQGELTSPGAFVPLSHRQRESSQTRGKPKSGKKLYQMQKSGSQPNSSENPQALNDLNVLLKAIEKDLSEKLKTNSGTPNNSILKKIED